MELFFETLFTLVLLGFGILFIFAGIKNFSSETALSKEKTHTNGKILSIKRHNGTGRDGGSITLYETLVQLFVDGTVYSGTICLDSKDIMYFTVGSDIPIIYQKSNPENFRYAQTKLGFPSIFAIIGGVGFIIFAFYFLFSIIL